MDAMANSSYDIFRPVGEIAPLGLLSLQEPSYLSLSILVPAAATILMLSTYLTTYITFIGQAKRTVKLREPRIFPYSLPFIGNALSFGFSPSKCVIFTSQAVGPNTAYGLKLLGSTLYFLSGRDNIKKIQKYKGIITDPGVQTFCLIRVFGMSQKAVEVYNKDDSSIQPKPVPTSSVAPNKRIDFHTHSNFVKMLSGDGLNTLFQRWHASFSRRVEAMHIGRNWIEGADVEKLWMTPLTAALNEAMAGPVLECVGPTFTQDFIEFLPFVHSLMKGLPKWCMPRAFVLRERLRQNVWTWHSIARTLFKKSDVDESTGADPWWGLGAIRERQAIFGKIEDWDHDDMASSDFGLLWGANINVHTAAIWMLVEVFRDANLLARVRAEVDTLTSDPTESNRWIEEVMALPLLQSIYSEVLRLRVDVQTVFRDNREDIQINEWRFPKKSLLLVPARPAHMDEEYWNTRSGRFPLDRFWADRFLAYPDDPESGPARLGRAEAQVLPEKKAAKPSHGQPKFVTAGTSDSWIPYGVGERACPGRFFARREIVGFCAIMVQSFDIELLSLDAGEHVASNDVFYGLGVQRPRDALPFRMRRREQKQ